MKTQKVGAFNAHEKQIHLPVSLKDRDSKRFIAVGFQQHRLMTRSRHVSVKAFLLVFM